MAPKKPSRSVAATASTNSRKRFSSNIRWQFVANVSQAFLGGAYLVVLGRFLGPAEFGVFSAVMAVISVLGLIFEMRLQEVVARDFCHLDDEIPGLHPHALHVVDLFVLEIVSRALPLFALLLLSDWLARSISLQPDATNLLALAAVGFMASKSGNSVSTGLLRVLGRTDLIAGCMAADWGLRLVGSLIVALAWHLDVKLVLWIALAVGVLCNGTQVWLAYREFTMRIAPVSLVGWSFGSALGRLRAARRLIISNLGVSGSDLMAKDLDVAMISSVLSADKVGLYKMAKSFVQVIWRAIDPFYIAIMPEIQKRWQLGETASLITLLRKTSVRLLLFSITLVVMGTVIVSLVGDKVLGANYSEVPELMLTMSVWVVVCAPLIWGMPLAVAVNRPELSVVGSGLGLIVGLTAFKILTPTLGLIGAGLAWNATLISGFVFTAVVSAGVMRSSLRIQC